MRVLVVSAHYPPNFVSGGTLQPQRLAHALRYRGHDVSVYAGWLGERPPLETWTDVDDTGMPVRWIVTTPWTGWSDRRNYDNPAVARDFAEHLAKVRPDVVHIHALQSLGAGLVSVAKAGGAKVVVTMHDFWWSCARQFLVTREFQPCCLVVSAGTCPCEVDHDWLEERGERLKSALAAADVILAPSASAARVLAANGIPDGRLIVNENGLPEATTDRATRPKDRPRGLHAVYTGGANEMKGAHVVYQCAEQLAGAADLTLTAYGMQPWLDREQLDSQGLPLRVLPPFSPEELNDVLSSADVLVLPSIMRESHSLITREALVRAVPVVTTDCLGPEEVVQHEHNGLVIPAGDAGALARAIQRLAEEPGLLQRLTQNASAQPAKGLETQVDQLEDIYRSLPDTSSRAAGSTVRRVLFIVGIEGAPLRYRARLPAEALRLLGVEAQVKHYRDPALPDLVVRADVVVVYRVPATPQVLYLLALAGAHDVPRFFDVDDLIFDPEVKEDIPALRLLSGDEAALWMEGVRRYRTTMEACDGFIGSTSRLCEHAERVVGLPAERFANGVGLRLGRISDEALKAPREPGPARLGYFSGTTTHDDDWRSVEPAVLEVMDQMPDVELWLGGHLKTSAALERHESRVRRLAFMPWTELPSLLRQVDVNLAPLEGDGYFNDAKSAIKWLEAALVETVTVASPTQPFREVVASGKNGILASNHEEWTRALTTLLGDLDVRERLGRAARRDALLHLSPHVQGPRYLAMLERGRAHASIPRGISSWKPIANDEPFIPVGLEPYDEVPSAMQQITGVLSPARARVRRVTHLLHIARLMVHQRGLRTTALRAAAYASRRVISRRASGSTRRRG